MVLLPETAFVHAGNDSGIFEDCCSLLVLRHPIILGDGKGKLVRNIIVLGVKNREKLTLLDIVSIFQEEKLCFNFRQNRMEEMKNPKTKAKTITSPKSPPSLPPLRR